jgi:hypothetical protein
LRFQKTQSAFHERARGTALRRDARVASIVGCRRERI